MTHVQDLIAAHPTSWMSVLSDEYRIKISKDSETDTRLVSLKYNQIESDMSNPIVRQCRGMVVDVKANRIMAYPYDKFHNYGEHLASEIDWRTARKLEKLDGSLMLLFFDDVEDAWRVASSGHPTAAGSVGKHGEVTFKDLFWSTFNDLKMCIPDHFARGTRSTTFMFELCTSLNRVVVQHDKPRIVLHGARDLDTGDELNPIDLEVLSRVLNWELVKSFDLSSIDDVTAAAAALNPLDSEGFIIVDGRFNRVKVKSPRYVALHHLRSDFTQRRSIELWRAGEIEELLLHFEDMRKDVMKVSDALDDICAKAEADLLAFRGTPGTPKKEFAMAVKDTPWAAVTFKLWADVQWADVPRGCTRSLMSKLPLSALEKILEAVGVAIEPGVTL